MPPKRRGGWRRQSGSAVPGADSSEFQGLSMAVDRSMAERGAHGEFIAVRDQAVRREILAVGVVLTLTLLAATLCAAGASQVWLFDLAMHFYVQYAALALVGFVLLLV